MKYVVMETVQKLGLLGSGTVRVPLLFSGLRRFVGLYLVWRIAGAGRS